MMQIINMLVIVEDIFIILLCLGICICKKMTIIMLPPIILKLMVVT
jgi:hypothetical protein